MFMTLIPEGLKFLIFILTPQDLLRYENWETILFVFGMMTVIETMSESGFFRWLGLHSAKWVKLDPLKLFISFSLHLWL
jgi:Na+/H+ antiporter NhaD/arsenite permease-like protein